MTYTITTGFSRQRRALQLFTALRRWLQFHRTATKLDALPDYVLRDIGVERGSIGDLALKSAYASFGHTSR